VEERATRPMRIADSVACALGRVAAAWLAHRQAPWECYKFLSAKL
jgi:hypothetical protein